MYEKEEYTWTSDPTVETMSLEPVASNFHLVWANNVADFSSTTLEEFMQHMLDNLAIQSL